MRRRRGSRIHYGLIVIATLAVVWTGVALIGSSPVNAEEVPGPLLLAGSDCDADGPYVQYRVTNETDGDETLAISVDEKAVIGSARLRSAETKRGRIEWQGDAAQSVVLQAKWATNDAAPVSIISIAPNPCVTISADDFSGPGFMAGTACQDDEAIVRWWMSNTSDQNRDVFVSVSTEDGSIGETIWPPAGAFESLGAGDQATGIDAISTDYPAGSAIRVSGWSGGEAGTAETWTQMVVPHCARGDLTFAAGETSTRAPTTTAVASGDEDALSQILATPPPVATTAGAGDGSSSSSASTTQPGETTSTQPRQPTTTRAVPTTTTPAPPAETSAPVFLAGADCSENGAFIRYRVTNNNDSTQTLQITFDGSIRVDAVTIDGGQTKWGTFTGAGGSNEPKAVIASWVGVTGSAAPTLLMRASICQDGLSQPARGPAFVTGQDCSGSTPIVRWWMKNTAPTTQAMNVSITNDSNSGELILWPSGGGTVEVDPEVQTAGVYTLPSGYNAPGQEVRIRGWWRGVDPDAHNRVGIVFESCP